MRALRRRCPCTKKDGGADPWPTGGVPAILEPKPPITLLTDVRLSHSISDDCGGPPMAIVQLEHLIERREDAIPWFSAGSFCLSRDRRMLICPILAS